MRKNNQILVVEDQKLFRYSIKSVLNEYGQVIDCESASQAALVISRHQFQMAFIDIDLETKGAGFGLIRDLIKKETFVVILSSHSSDEVIEKAYQLGCHSYYVKSADTESLRKVIDEYEEWVERKTGPISNKKEEFFKNEFITEDADLKQAVAILFEAKSSELPIFLTGPTGVGKTTLAKKAHALSNRKEENFVDVNCANIPSELLESELFGHVQGAFTGAVKDKKGKLLLAHKGTIFLDEIATLPVPLQEKLLKALEEKMFYPVGSEKPVKSNFRLMSATSADIKEMITNGKFKLDLFFRISGIDIHIKPLKERRSDIILHIKKAMDGQRRVVITKEARNSLLNYDWPGNTREINSQIHRLLHNSKNTGNRIGLENLPDFIVSNTPIFVKKGGFEILTDEQFEYIEKMGIKKFEEEVRKFVVHRLEQKSVGVTEAMSIMKLSNTAFYSVKNKMPKLEERRI